VKRPDFFVQTAFNPYIFAPIFYEQCQQQNVKDHEMSQMEKSCLWRAKQTNVYCQL